MDPPRIPLNPIHRQNTLLPLSSAPATSDPSAPMKPPKPPKRLIAPELMDDFKAEVEGNDLTKVGLLEILKKK
jgi:chromatin assembly factor 1 subunit A